MPHLFCCNFAHTLTELPWMLHQQIRQNILYRLLPHHFSLAKTSAVMLVKTVKFMSACRSWMAIFLKNSKPSARLRMFIFLKCITPYKLQIICEIQLSRFICPWFTSKNPIFWPYKIPVFWQLKGYNLYGPLIGF